MRSLEETVVYEIGRQQYEPLLLAHPEWMDELATVMEQRLIRRQARLADLVEMETDSRPQPCWNGSDATSSADITDPGDLDASGTVSSVRATR